MPGSVRYCVVLGEDPPVPWAVDLVITRSPDSIPPTITSIRTRDTTTLIKGLLRLCWDWPDSCSVGLPGELVASPGRITRVGFGVRSCVNVLPQ